MARQKTDGFRARDGQRLTISAQNHNAWCDAADQEGSEPKVGLGGTITPARDVNRAGLWGRNDTGSTLERGQAMDLGEFLAGDEFDGQVYDLDAYTGAGTTAICEQVIANNDIGRISIGGGRAGSVRGVFVRDADNDSEKCKLASDGVYEADDDYGPYKILEVLEIVTGGAMCVIDTSAPAIAGVGGMYPTFRAVVAAQLTTPNYTVTLDIGGSYTAVNLWERDPPEFDPLTMSGITTRVPEGQSVIVHRDTNGYFFYASGIIYGSASEA